MILQFNLTATATYRLVFLAATFLIFSVHAKAAGALDPAFGVNGRASAAIGNSALSKAVAIQPDGKIVVVGDYLASGDYRDIAIVRFDANGNLDQSFGSGGKVITSFSETDDLANAVAIQADGKIIVAGSTQPFADFPSADFLLVRYNSNGSLDTTFGSGGKVIVSQGISDVFNAVMVQPDGKIVAAGKTSDGDRSAVLRFNPDGSLDNTFGNGGLAYFDFERISNEKFYSIALFPNGRIVAAGIMVDGAGLVEVLAVLEPNGVLAQDFGNQGVVLASLLSSSGLTQGYDVLVTADNKIITANGVASRRFSSSGAFETSFGINGFGGGANGIALFSNGNFVVTRNFGSNYAEAAAVYGKNGQLIASSNRVVPNFGTSFRGNDVAVQADDKIIILNVFFGNSTEFRVTRLLSVTSNGTRRANFDLDEVADIAVLRPSNSTLYVLSSLDGTKAYPTGEASFEVHRVIPETYGNPLSASQFSNLSFAYWKSGSILGTQATFCGGNDAQNRRCFQWGFNTDVPVGGDYDGDNRTDVAVFRPSDGVWYITQSSNNQFRAVRWGLSGDKPVPADYDYDGITDVAVYRPSNGTWYVRRSSDENLIAVQWGNSSDIPLTGDFDGDGRADFVVFRPSNGTWYLLQSKAGFRAEKFGLENDQPVPGDYDGDGRHDIAVFRQGIWYILGSTRGFSAVQWGAASDVPVSVRYAY